MNVSRILAVFYKDAMWAVNNPKLLVLVLIPPLISLFFQFAGKGAMAGFSIVFTFAMIGSLLGSYLITEEKRIESLKNILITPLTSLELAIGKFLLPLTLCLVFAFFTFFLSNKIHLYFTPWILVSLLLMGSTVCLFGLFMGLVAKNEQELGVISPFFILAFLAGSVGAKTSAPEAAGFFPEYHLIHLIENFALLSQRQVFTHVVFLFAESLAVLLIVATYLKFFFSNDADSKRFNAKSVLSCIPFIIFLAVSGFTTHLFRISSMSAEGKEHFTLKWDDSFSATLAFDLSSWTMSQMESEDTRAVIFDSKDKLLTTIKVVLLKLKDDELESEQRVKKYTEKDGVHYLYTASPAPGLPEFSKHVYTSDSFYKTAYERQCGRQLLRIHFAHPVNAKEYKALDETVSGLINNAKVDCGIK